MQEAQSNDMDGRFVAGNLVDPLKFVDEFLPADEDRPDLEPFDFSDEAVGNEKIWAEEANKLCKLLGIYDILEFFDTHHAGSQSEGESRCPDITAFARAKSRQKDTPFEAVTAEIRQELKATKFRELFRYAALIIERKLATQDGFVDSGDEPQEKPTQTSRRVRGQLICYNLHHFREQPRIFSFQVLFIHKFARLIRWDRAGAVVTEAFDWTEGTMFSDFLSRFASASRKQRGLDTTVRAATKKEAEKLAAACKADELPIPKEPYWAYEVVDEPLATQHNSDEVDATQEDSDSLSDLSSLTSSSASTNEPESQPPPARAPSPRSESREFIVGRPVSHPRAFTGRTSSGFIAYDVEAKTLSYLKDAWRPNDPDIVPEGETYRRLQIRKDEEGGEFIPTLVCAGDVYDSDAERQETLTHKYAPKGSRANSRVRRYMHARTVVREVGVPMAAFKTASDLLQLMCDTIKAHKYATQRHILHRDISPGNIMINRKKDTARALLVDWDLAMDMRRTPTYDQRFITGTWQFMSIMVLRSDKHHQHDLQDDLESIFWLLCYSLVRFTNLHPGSDEVARDFLRTYFDDSRLNVEQREGQPKQRKGGTGKEVLLKHMARMFSDIQTSETALPLTPLFQTVSQSLYYHFMLRDMECQLVALRLIPERTPNDERVLKYVEKELKGHQETAPDWYLDYTPLWTAFDAARTGIKEAEPSSNSLGSMRVKDRYEHGGSGGQLAKDVGASERVEKRTTCGGVKRGSDHEDEPQSKAPRPSTPGRTRSGHSTASGSFRQELMTIEDNSPLKGKAARAEK